MALRKEDLQAGDAVVLRFPQEVALRRASRDRMLARRRRAAAVALGGILAIGWLFTAVRDGTAHASRPGAPAAVTVRSGDTLWDVAERFAPPGSDPRAYVDLLIESNDLAGGHAIAGTRLKLPR